MFSRKEKDGKTKEKKRTTERAGTPSFPWSWDDDED
jgi:hypothetical protein